MGLRAVHFECSKESGQLRMILLEGNPKGSCFGSTASWTAEIGPCTRPINIGRAVRHLGRPFQRHSSLAERTDAW